MYTHLSIWMPTDAPGAALVCGHVEQGLWDGHFRQEHHSASCALVTLACECAVTGTAWDLIPCLPLLGGALAVLYATHTLSPACKSYLNKQLSAKPWKGKGGGTAGSSLASIAPEARASMSSAHHAKDPVGALGGCGPAALLLSEANILSDSDASSSHEATQRLVDSAIKGIVSSAVVAALIFSTIYDFAYEEGEALQRLVAAGPASGWGIEEVADLTSCVADFVCILMASVAILLGSILYSQISYWMPSLEARLWYVNALSTAARPSTSQPTSPSSARCSRSRARWL